MIGKPIPDLLMLAYIDPGSGAMVWQLLVAGVLGVVFSTRRAWGRFLTKFKRKQD
ncbi:MAG: hypothetical protein ACM3QZ_08855 [Solirubrobacterales bacterium]